MPRNTARTRSSRLASSRDDPLEAHLALLEEHGAVGELQRDVERLLDDDDRHALLLQPVDDAQQVLHDDGREAERQLVDEEHVRLVQQRHREREHLLLATRQRRRHLVAPPGEVGEQLEHVGDAPPDVGGVVAVHERTDLQVLADRHVGEDALATGQHLDAAVHAPFGGDVRDRLPVEADHAPRRGAEAGDDPQDRRLAGAVGAEQREHLALAHLEADVEQHLHLAVGEVDRAHLDRRHLRRRLLATLLLGELLAQLGDDQRHVVLDELGAAAHEVAADQRRRDREDQDRRSRAGDVDEQRSDERTDRRATEEHVQAAERSTQAAQPVRHDRHRDRADHGERGDEAQADRDASDREQDGRRHRVLDRDEDGDRHDQQADHPHRPRRVTAERRIEPLGEHRREDHRQDAADRGEHPALERLEAEAVLQVQVAEHASGEQAEAERDEAEHHGAVGADLLEPREGGLDRDRLRLGLLLEHLTEDLAHLLLAAPWFGDAEREEREDERRDAEDVEGPPPTLVTTGDRSDPADEQRAEDPHRAAGRHRHAAEAATHADRVPVRDQRSADRAVVGLRDADTEPGEEQRERVDRLAAGEHHRPVEQVGEADDPVPAVAIGEVSHREGAEDQEGARRADHERDRPVRHVQRVGDVGREQAERSALELLQRRQEDQDDERVGAALREPLAQRHRLAADAGQ